MENVKNLSKMLHVVTTTQIEFFSEIRKFFKCVRFFNFYFLGNLRFFSTKRIFFQRISEVSDIKMFDEIFCVSPTETSNILVDGIFHLFRHMLWKSSATSCGKAILPFINNISHLEWENFILKLIPIAWQLRKVLMKKNSITLCGSVEKENRPRLIIES